MAERTEIRSLTGLRGVAAIYVMLYHYLGNLTPKGHLGTLLSHGYLAVDLFFSLSGFVMGLTYAHMFTQGTLRASYLKFLGRRIARVYPLYLGATLCAAALIASGWLEYRSHILAVDLPLNLAMMQTWVSHASLDAPGWSISAELAAYLVFPWLVYLTLSPRRWVTAATLLVAFGLVVVVCSIPVVLRIDHGIAVIRCLGEFTLGLFAFRMTEMTRVSSLREVASVEPLVAALLLAALVMSHSDFVVILLCPIFLFCLSSDRFVVSKMLRTRIAHRLGVLSFSIYLIHDLLSGLMGEVHRFANQKGFAHGQTVAAVVAIPLTLILAEVACRWIEIPGRRATRRLFEWNRSRVALAA